MKPLFIFSLLFISSVSFADVNANQEHALPTEAQLRAIMLSVDPQSAAQDNTQVSKSAVKGPLKLNQNDGRGRLKLDITPYPGVIVPHNFFNIQIPLFK